MYTNKSCIRHIECAWKVQSIFRWENSSCYMVYIFSHWLFSCKPKWHKKSWIIPPKNLGNKLGFTKRQGLKLNYQVVNFKKFIWNQVQKVMITWNVILKEETSNVWVMLIPECVALPPVASAASNFVNSGSIFTPHNQGFLKPLSILPLN